MCSRKAENINGTGMEYVNIKAKDGLMLSAAVFEPDYSEPEGIMQIIHGAAEHKKRYFELAEFLCKNNYAVIVSDLRGHGASVNDKYPLGFMDGIEEIIEDQMLITRYIKNRYPDKKLVLFGHSLGSLIARSYLKEHDDEIEKLILSGTVSYVKPAAVGVAVTELVTLVTGKYTCEKFAKFFNGSEADDSWVCSVPEVLDEVRNDPLCKKVYGNSALLTICRADHELHNYESYKCRNKGLKILSISGSDDPVTGGTKGLKDTKETLRKIGYRNIKNIVYQGMRHEVINEYGKQQVYEDILEFIKND